MRIPQYCKAMKVSPIKTTILQNSNSTAPFVAYGYHMKWKVYGDLYIKEQSLITLFSNLHLFSRIRLFL